MSDVIRNIGQGKLAKSNDNVLISVRIPTDKLKIKYIGNIWKILFGKQFIKIAYKSQYTQAVFILLF